MSMGSVAKVLIIAESARRNEYQDQFKFFKEEGDSQLAIHAAMHMKACANVVEELKALMK